MALLESDEEEAKKRLVGRSRAVSSKYPKHATTQLRDSAHGRHRQLWRV